MSPTPSADGTARPRVYLIDASIYVFRAWHVLPDTLVDRQGEPAHAVHGFVDFLAQFHQLVRAEHVAVCFDTSLTHSARNELFPAYKANRDPAPPELIAQFRRCREITRQAGFAEFANRRFEADDLIATLCGVAHADGHPATVVTGDKDLAQLVRDDGEWWDFARDRRLNADGVRKTFGVRPDQIADMLALAGDRIDNIPGVPGIGVSTAGRLLSRWDNLDTLYANLPGVSTMKFRGAARIARLLAEHESTVRLARQLTGMLEADGLPERVALLQRQPADRNGLDRELDDLGMSEGHRAWLIERLEKAPA